MKRPLAHLLVSLLAFLTGLTVAALPLMRRHAPCAVALPATPISFNGAFAETLLQPAPTPETEYDYRNYTLKIPIIRLEEIYTTQDTLSYQDYAVTRHYNTKLERAFATVKRNGRVLAKFEEEGFPPDKQLAIQFGLFPFLGGERKQLIVAQYSGGAHCCYYFRIYELHPAFRLIFDSRKFPVEDYMSEAVVLDIDKDGVFELSATINSFAYFHGIFAGSVMPDVAFKYDQKAKQYLPANHLFPAYSLDRVEEEIKKVEEMNASDEVPDYDYFYYTLDVTLRYIYAGRQQQAWDFFERAYRNQTWYPKEKLRASIKEILREDGVYLSLYSH